MADRADYLARTLIGRLSQLAASFAEDDQSAPDRQQRMAAVEKVLAIELGITDSAIVASVEAAVPTVDLERRGTDREVAAFAEFLRTRLGSQLLEP